MNKVSETVEAVGMALEAQAGAPLPEKVAIYNEISRMLAEWLGLPHPATGTQLVSVERVHGNDYNPNRVAPPEMRLLELSIRKDGITMPVVVAEDREHPGEYVVVDGFHRTTIAQHVADIRESLGGYLPVVMLNKSIEDRMTATVRHNMARGSHQVELSAKLVTALRRHHWTNERIGEELGMDPDEVLRLKQITGLAEAFQDKEFSEAWE